MSLGKLGKSPWGWKAAKAPKEEHGDPRHFTLWEDYPGPLKQPFNLGSRSANLRGHALTQHRLVKVRFGHFPKITDLYTIYIFLDPPETLDCYAVCWSIDTHERAVDIRRIIRRIKGWLTDGSPSAPGCSQHHRGPVWCRLLQRSGFEPALNKCFDSDTGILLVKYAEDNKIRKVASKQENSLPLQSDLDYLVKWPQSKRKCLNMGNCNKGPVSLHWIKQAYF